MPMPMPMPMPMHRHRALRTAAGVTLGLLALSGLAQAATPSADAQRLRTRALAATCAHCHGTDGRAVEGLAMVRLAGMNREHLLTQLLAFRTGQRPATIMHQITRGYSQEQLEEVSTYFAGLK